MLCCLTPHSRPLAVWPHRMNNRFQIQKRRRISAVLLALLAFVLSCSAQAQRASISGTVADQSGRALPDVRITLLNVDQGLQREVVSKADGSFYVPWLQPGRYVISGQKNGFAVA